MALDMTKGKPLNLLAKFGFPLMLTAVFQQLYSLSDTVIVGQLLGSEAFAAIGSAAYLDGFPVSMMLGLSQGFGVVLSQRFGAKDEKGFRRALAMSVLMSILVAGVITTVGLCFQQDFLRMMQTPEALFGYLIDYLRILWLGLAVTAVHHVLGSALRALGDSRTPFLSLVLSTALKLSLNYLFIAGFHMGVKGVALATLLSRGGGIAFCLWRLRKTAAFAVPALGDMKPHGPSIKALLRLGVPPMLGFAVTSTGELAVQAVFNMQGVAFVTGLAAAKQYLSLLNIVGFALEGALGTFVGQNTGARQMKRVFGGTRMAVRVGVLTSGLTTALVILFRRPLILLLLPQGSPEIIQIAMDALCVQALFVSALCLLCLHRAAIQGMGNAVIPMISGFLELALRFACVWMLPLLFGRESLYFIDAITWTGTAMMLVAAYYFIRNRIRGEESPETIRM